MSDWADERAIEVTGKITGIDADSQFWMTKQKRIADALRPVERETAEECIRMAIAEVESAPELADAIKARFGLDKGGRCASWMNAKG